MYFDCYICFFRFFTRTRAILITINDILYENHYHIKICLCFYRVVINGIILTRDKFHNFETALTSPEFHIKRTTFHTRIQSNHLISFQKALTYASVKGNLELPLLKGRRRFDVETTSNLEVYIFRGWWILTLLIFSQCESLPYVNLGLVNLERTRFISRVKTCWTQKLIMFQKCFVNCSFGRI